MLKEQHTMSLRVDPQPVENLKSWCIVSQSLSMAKRRTRNGLLFPSRWTARGEAMDGLAQLAAVAGLTRIRRDSEISARSEFYPSNPHVVVPLNIECQ